MFGRVESWSISPQAVAAFGCIVFIRYFLEALLEGHHVLAPHLDLRLAVTDLLHVLLFFIGAHFKDIKDYQGDQLAGVATLATWLGPNLAYWWIGGGVLAMGGMMWYLGVLKASWATWSAFALFALGWLVLRNAERLFAVMLVALALLFVGV